MQFRRAWVEENCSSSVLNNMTNGYVLPFHLKPKLTRHPLIISEYKNQQKDRALASCIQSLLHKHAIEKVRNTESLGLYSRLFLVKKAASKMETSHRLKQAKSIPEDRKIQDGDPRINKNILEYRGMGDINRPTRRLPPYPNSPKIPKIPAVCTQVSDISVHLSSIRASPSSSSIHHDSKRGKIHGLITGHKDTPISGRLADQGSISGGVISQHKSGGRPNRISRLDDKSGQIGVDSNSSILVCEIRIPSKLSPCKAHSGEVAKNTGINPQDNQPVCPDCKTFDVSHWVASINRKNGPRRPPSHETFSVASQGELDISSVIGQAPSLVRLHNSSSGLVAESTKCSQRCRSPPPRTQRSSVYRRLKRRLGRSLKSRFYQRTVVRSRKIIAHKCFRTKGSVLGPKTLQASMPKSNSPDCHGQLNGRSLHQQTGWDSLSRDVCPSMENHELVSSIQNISMCQTHSRVPKCDRGLPVQINSNSVNGVITAPSGVQRICTKWFTPQLDLFATRLNHKMPLYSSPVPDQNAWNIDALNISWSSLVAYAYPPTALLPKVIQKVRQYNCLLILIAPGRACPGSGIWSIYQWKFHFSCLHLQICSSSQATRCFTTIRNTSTSMLGV